ncbi:bifunctional 3-(3-hydroxy-phenyl)propionate/3-hydroxycinnamic acid hydroxylase [Streptomyces radicis]|uniref:Bifunctional 3-(3-hydroxy-phenyl)propionate/3-hydroxycinnamic acid hydroxylase n=1 Tax=Streptomyces radicis TaxID=1750517 RepID=A0A3A9W7T2_9ACTN|nr:bifunctional 3-(3-hydroxy-phenyl)propionate/3-hydroxycinnamic acid hydroxylase [Streptomyces radicis]RKN03586.1 bifunctional 3-(3-hydroxy-phenyl)propionate/3-hydroxycinnamic acid hydroxylase [Streptomyces radicis]RKN13448.1 bifunctional 3-(3-hydroxy-phenyl)propionate/3-hydroxycinnamic acid hydroxylase [Streptomyces radicis]
MTARRPEGAADGPGAADAWDEAHEPDVAIVGYGPVGQLLAILLAQRGRRVTVVERWPHPYPMPRAVAFDGEAARVLAAAGIGDHLAAVGEPSGDYAWRNAAGDELLRIEAADEIGHSGWPDSTSMYQPGLESALIARGAALAGLRVLRGYEAVGLAEAEDRVRLTVRDADGGERVIAARWLVGCDGANSFVRAHIGSSVTDLGFFHDWLVCDVVLREPREFKPNNLQICDPARPRTEVSAGPGHRRWEFMRVPGETADGLNDEETAWRLLASFGVTPENATLERHSVYTFQARTVDRWRAGRVLLAGDAAHLMPPFAGQGMSSGFRDAANLAWKLDLVLRGLADEGLIDTYPLERRAHVRHAIEMSVNLGRVICQTDQGAARDRDTVMLAARKRAPAASQGRTAVRPLADGLLAGAARDGGGAPAVPPAGQLTPQGRVARGARTGLFDAIVGHGFVLLTAEDPRPELNAERLAFLAGLDARVVWVRAPDAAPPTAHEGSGDTVAVTDVDGTWLRYLAASRAAALLVRPDFYVFGAARDLAGVGPLVDELRARL